MFDSNFQRDELPIGSEYVPGRDDENLPEASTTDPSRILNSDEYEVYKNVPVFVEHTRTLKSGRELKFGRDELEKLAARSNRRIEETGDFAPVVIGHTNPDPSAPDPPKIGWAGPFRLGWLTKDHTKYAVLADFRIEKDKTSALNKYPRRSAELWAEDKYEDMYLDPISLLGADTPWSDMGVLYCKQGDADREKIYYSIAPQAPGAYGTGGFPNPVVIKNASEPKREKEQYSMTDNNENGYEEPKKLNQDQMNVADAIVGAIFDSPEFKFLRKLMDSGAAKEDDSDDAQASEPASEPAIPEQNQAENGDSEEISEKIEENPISSDNKTPVFNELSSENAQPSEDDSENASDSDAKEAAPLDENDDDSDSESDSVAAASGADEEEDEDDDELEIERLKRESGLSDDEFDKIDAMSDEEFEKFLDEKYGADSEESESETEPESDEEEEEGDGEEEDEDDSEKYSLDDSGANPYMNKTLDELEEYLEGKYGEELPEKGTPEYSELASDLGYLAYLMKSNDGEENEEEDFDSESEIESEPSEDSKDGVRVKYEKFGERGAINPYMDRTVEELESLLRSKYGETEPPKIGTPEFDELANDPCYLAFFIKSAGIGEDDFDDEDDEDSEPYDQVEDTEEMTPSEYYSRRKRDEEETPSYAEEEREEDVDEESVDYEAEGEPVDYDADSDDDEDEESGVPDEDGEYDGDDGYDVTKDPQFAALFSDDEDDDDLEDEPSDEDFEDDDVDDVEVVETVIPTEDDEEIAPDYSLVDEEDEPIEYSADSETEEDEGEEDDDEEEEEEDEEEEPRPVEYAKERSGDGRSRADLLGEIDSLQNRIKQLEQAFDWTTEKVVSAERYAKLHDLRARYIFDEAQERENCRYFKMSDEQFARHCDEIQTNYRRVPTGIEVPPGLVSSAPADAERPGAIRYAKEESEDFERKVSELAEDYAARGIYKPSDEIRAEVAAKTKKSSKSDQ